MRVILRDERCGKWLDFRSPLEVIATRCHGDVLPLLHYIEDKVRQERLYAAGFIAYEAASAFDPSLPARVTGDFPLIWFGLFGEFHECTMPSDTGETGVSIPWRPSVTREEYDRCVRRIRNFIRDGETYQVNYSYRLRALTDIDPWRLFLQIAGDEGAPLAAFVDTGEWAICSASPELFLRLDGTRIESRPMKGTAPRGLWYEQDMENKKALSISEKDRAENVMIVDMVRNDLGRIARWGSVRVSSLFRIERYPTVWQMTSTVAARTEESLCRILQSVFPPASVTGAPKRRTMEIIAKLESSPRRVYTGSIGFMAPDRRAQFNVAIRTILLNKSTRHAEYGVGGGIVWDSKPANEYEECCTKTRVLTPRARDFDLLETIRWSPKEGYWLLRYHMRRLARSADFFGFKVDVRKLRAELARVGAGLPPRPHRLRLTVSRRGNARYEAVPLESRAMHFGNVTLGKMPVDKSDVFLYHKTTRRRVYEDALRMCPEFDDVLLFNEEGQVTETTIANVAVEIDGLLCTPPVYCGLLPGTYRASLLEQGRLQERMISVQDVYSSPNVYLLNSVRGIQKVSIHFGREADDISADSVRPKTESLNK